MRAIDVVAPVLFKVGEAPILLGPWRNWQEEAAFDEIATHNVDLSEIPMPSLLLLKVKRGSNTTYYLAQMIEQKI